MDLCSPVDAVFTKSPAQIVVVNALKMTPNALSIYCHTNDHSLSVLSERTKIGLLEDIPIDPDLLDGVARPPAPESVIGFFSPSE